MSRKRTFRSFGVVVTALGLALVASTASYSAPSDPDGAADGTVRASAAETTTVRYGPFDLGAASDDHQGWGTGNVRVSDVRKPCVDCYVTGIEPDLVYEDGSTANVDTGPMLHHMVMADRTATDVTCNVWPGQRIFAVGNERVGNQFPAGYGMRVDGSDQWDMLYDLMNHAHEAKTVYLSITYTHQPASSGLTDLTPVWLDADGACSDSAWDAPAGVSERSTRWTSSISGDLVYMAGHLHHGGTEVWTDNRSTGAEVCRSVSEEAGSSEYVDHHGHTYISDMSECRGDPVARVTAGDELEITARYDLDEPHNGVMGIMIGWFAEN